MTARWVIIVLGLGLAPGASAQHEHHHHHGMTMDASGMVMNENHDRLPRDCAAVSGDVAFEVRAGVAHAADYPGSVFGMTPREWQVPPCARVTVTFHNEDQVRHQWMVHGLPRYLYPGGMFHLEAAGGATQTGTFIVPSDARTYLVHCDMAQHMEMGMKGQLKVGSGEGDLWAIPGVSAPFRSDDYLPPGLLWWMGAAAALAALLGWRWSRQPQALPAEDDAADEVGVARLNGHQENQHPDT